MESQDVGIQARKLSDGTAGGIEVDSTSWMVRFNGFFMDKAYGSLFLNMIADVLVRCMCALTAFILPLLGCGLAFGCCQRARSKKQKFSALQLQQLSEIFMERERAFWHDPDNNFCKLLQEAASRPAAAGHGLDTSTSSSTNSTVLSVPQTKSHVPENGYIEMSPQTPEIHPPSSSSSSSSTIDTLPLSTKQQSSALISGDEKRPVKPDVRKRLNGLIHHQQIDEEKLMKHGGIISGGSVATFNENTSVEPQGGASKHEHILDIPVLAVLPSSASLESGDELKKLFMVKLSVKVILDKFSSRILQGIMATSEENLRCLRELAVEGMKIDKGFTLQIDRFYMYHCKGNPEELALLSLRGVEVPTILQAEYVAGVLTIRGHFLEGAEIRVTTSDKYLILHPEKQEKSLHVRGIEEWTCTNLLLPVKLNEISIFASKKVCIQGEHVTVRSEASPMVDNTLRSLVREWIPTIIVFFCVSKYLISLIVALLNYTLILQFPQLWLPHLAPALVIYILQLLPSSIEKNIKSIVNTCKLICASFKFAPLTEATFTKRENAQIQQNVNKTPTLKGDNLDSTIVDINMDSTQNQEQNSPSNLDWQWLHVKQRYSKATGDWITETFNSATKQHQVSQPFEVIYRFTAESVEEDYLPNNVIVKIYSKGLQSFLTDKSTRHLQVYEDYAEIQAKYIFQAYLKGDLDKSVAINIISSGETSSNEESQSRTTQLHVFHLIRFIEKEFEKTLSQYQHMVSQGIITWDMLWTIFQEKEKVVYYCEISKEELCGILLSWTYVNLARESSRERSTFEIELEVWDYNCVNYESRTVRLKIPGFLQECKILNLDVYPIRFSNNAAKTEAFFLERGKKYHNLVIKNDHCFLQYKGLMFWSFDPVYDESTDSYLQRSHRESVDGRVMVDQGSYAKMKPKRRMGTAQPEKGWLQGNMKREKNLPSEDDPNLQFAPTIVYGFSFTLRKWGCFLIHQLHEITFSPIAFDTLVMKEERTKRMLLAMTEYYIKNPPSNRTEENKLKTVDPLPNKGLGSIILLHGPPGTGKTLTVESLAEKMECPLWQISVSKLDLKPKKLETRLVQKFEIAVLWGAIMLLDEADVYLSSRKYSHLASVASQGNILTSVFLRILEYYKGILFLTTNQIESFEPAIYSRISVFVKYDEFNVDERRQLWSNFMKRAGIPTATPSFWKEVLPMQLNGRVIRNIVCNAEILSKNQGKLLHEDHILDAFRVFSLSTPRGLFSEEEKFEFDKDGQDSLSMVPSYITHDHSSLSYG